MSANQNKSMPLTKDEVLKLVQLIEAHPMVFSKATNATNNQLKEANWLNITNKFNAIVASSPRRPEQLRLKWENLKKAARKRNTRIRMNNLKTGGGKPDYIPPDEALDQVAKILGPTCDGYSVQFGGDAVVELAEDVVVEELVEETAVVNVPSNVVPFEVETETPITTPTLFPHTPKPRKFFFNSTISKGKLKRQAVADEVKESMIKRNHAIAEYYTKKKQNEEMLVALKKRKIELKISQLEKSLQPFQNSTNNIDEHII